MTLVVTALAVAACSSSGSKGGTGLPSIPAVSPTSTPTAPSSSPTVTDSTSPSATASASSSPSASPSTSATASASVSASPSSSTQAGGGCPSSSLSLSLGESQGAAGNQIQPVIFTNKSGASCTLGGFPGVSFVTGTNGTQVGAAAVRSGSAGSALNLAPKQTAQVLVKIANTDNYDSSTCKPVSVLGLRVYPPGQTAALYVAFPDGGFEACSGSGVPSQLSVQSVTATS